MFAVLGEIELSVLACDGLDLTAGAAWAEHALIGRRPTVQWTGDALEQRRLECQFVDRFCDPVLQANRLRQALRDHQPLALVLGSGEHQGWFVITELQETPLFARATGTPRALRIAVTLLEYAGDPAQPVERPALRTEPLESVLTGPVPSLLDPVNAALRDAAQWAALASGYLAQALNLADLAQTLAANPLSALTLAPDLVAGLTQLNLPLGWLDTLLAGTGSVLTGAGAVAGTVTNLLAITGALGGLLGPDLEVANVATRYTQLALGLADAQARWRTGAAPTAAGWAAQSASRQGA